eukprot:Cvel_21467.t2-p1 / transcript=Cvel_21467.t2 / gene=Cvel_21467 / organism=Chromera_velia_CCMP2878 / gene_product=hypothetical protein / transcript_product=hypothetical protein / location=Cvel_scaffold2015:31336-32352(+) / protein_length=339 / sequence_SO=supercontig / SO=protein_coding / is_pseudo=false
MAEVTGFEGVEGCKVAENTVAFGIARLIGPSSPEIIFWKAPRPHLLDPDDALQSVIGLARKYHQQIDEEGVHRCFEAPREWELSLQGGEGYQAFAQTQQPRENGGPPTVHVLIAERALDSEIAFEILKETIDEFEEFLSVRFSDDDVQMVISDMGFNKLGKFMRQNIDNILHRHLTRWVHSRSTVQEEQQQKKVAREEEKREKEHQESLRKEAEEQKEREQKKEERRKSGLSVAIVLAIVFLFLAAAWMTWRVIQQNKETLKCFFSDVFNWLVKAWEEFQVWLSGVRESLKDRWAGGKGGGEKGGGQQETAEEEDDDEEEAKTMQRVAGSFRATRKLLR